MIDAVGIADQGIGQAGKVDQAVPLGVIAGEAGYFEAEHEANPGERHLGGQACEARARDRARTGEAKIFVDDDDALVGPAKVPGPSGQRVLPVRRLPVVFDLRGAGLAQIHDGLAGEMISHDLGALIHRSPPPPARARAFGR